jgi:hypothetical protein
MFGRKESKAAQLTWEWPAGREAEHRVGVQVVDLSPASGGLFGVKKSPSLVSGFPEPMRLQGKALDDEGDWAGKSLEVIVPRSEIPEVKAGDKVTLGLVGQVCIAVTKLPGS